VVATSAGAALPDEAYVWQRQWTPSLNAALQEGKSAFSGWRVLAAETDAPRHLRAVAVDWPELEATRKPFIAVVRIDGHVPIGEADFVSQILALETAWRARGVAPAGIEIDYDCGVARLADYANFLRTLRRTMPARQSLSVTALPSWLPYPDVGEVIAAADELVLQVHAVQAPQHGLFDPRTAKRWIAALDEKDAKPFRVALPDYSTRVYRDEQGAIVAVESETPRLMGTDTGIELVALPDDVAALVRDLNHDPPKHLAGFVWFRLPAATDRRTWSPETLFSVMAGKAPTASIAVETRPGFAAGALDIVLFNTGEADSTLPAEIDLPQGCKLADGVNGYTLAAISRRNFLERLQIGLLRAHDEAVIGWMRCRGTLTIHGRE
jgi:hypothetical protein